MGLRNIKVEEAVIPYGDGDITVRGLSASDLMLVVSTYGSQAALVFNKIQSGGSLQTTDVQALIASIAGEFPEMLAVGIALAADAYSPENVETLRRLPLPTQVQCIEEIFKLTFRSETEVKKLLESLTKMMAEVSGALTEVALPLPTGITESDAA